MTRIAFILAMLAAPALSFPAVAQEDTAPAPDALPLSYEVFEAAVPHIDLELCPVDLAGDERFCRMVLLNEKIQVFVFSEAGDQPMVGYRAWPADLLNGLLD